MLALVLNDNHLSDESCGSGSSVLAEQIGKVHNRVLALPPVDNIECIFGLRLLHLCPGLPFTCTPLHPHLPNNALLRHSLLFPMWIFGIVWNELRVLKSLSQKFG